MILVFASLFGTLCAPCQGDTGRGDGPAAHLYEPKPADLTGPLRLGDDIERTIRLGSPGTGMPSFAALGEERIRALAADVRALRAGTFAPGVSEPMFPVPPQGEKPLGLVYGLESGRCGTCHPDQHAAWATSRHGRAMGPGVAAQYHGATDAFRIECNGCHAPLAEQADDPELRAEGVSCAGCHVRKWNKLGRPRGRTGPPVPHGVQAVGERTFSSGTLCLSCHNLPLSVAVNGRPLLDTWREWAAGPYFVAGVQCQHCHMQGGEHGFRGAHDAEKVRRAVSLRAGVPQVGHDLELDVSVYNLAVGHHFPTTATPRAVLVVRQRSEVGVLPETERSWAIGRTVEYGPGGWVEVADTRIPAGRSTRRTYRAQRRPEATQLEVGLFLFPDWLYSRFYRAKLARRDLTEVARAEYGQAAEAAKGALLLHWRRVTIPRSAPPAGG